MTSAADSLSSAADSGNTPRKKPYGFKEGEIDNIGATIVRIYYQVPDYVVYRTNHSIRIETDDDLESARQFFANHSRIAVELAKIYSWLPEDLRKSEPINRQIARSVSENAKGNYDAAIKMLEHAAIRIHNLKTMEGRLQYTLSSLAMAGLLLLLVCGFSLWTYRDSSNALVANYYKYAKVAFCGTLGGIISVFLGFPKLRIDIDANAVTNCLIGASRIFISIAGAFFSYFAIQSGIAFSLLTSGSDSFGVYVVAMIAGFSEMLIPNIMTNLSTKAELTDPDSLNSSDRNSLLQPATRASAAATS